MKYFEGLSEDAQTKISWTSYHLFHAFVYKKYKANTLTKGEAMMLLSAAIAHSYLQGSKSNIKELESLPLFDEIKEHSKNPFGEVIV